MVLENLDGIAHSLDHSEAYLNIYSTIKTDKRAGVKMEQQRRDKIQYALGSIDVAIIQENRLFIRLWNKKRRVMSPSF